MFLIDGLNCKSRGLHFWRRIKITPDVTLNLSKSGGSLSFGPPVAKFTIGPRDKRATVGISGTGLFYTTTESSRRFGARRRSTVPAFDSDRPKDRLALGFFKCLITPKAEEAFVRWIIGLYYHCAVDLKREILRDHRPGGICTGTDGCIGHFIGDILTRVISRMLYVTLPDAYMA